MISRRCRWKTICIKKIAFATIRRKASKDEEGRLGIARSENPWYD